MNRMARSISSAMLLVAATLGAAGDELLVPLVDAAEVGETALGEGAAGGSGSTPTGGRRAPSGPGRAGEPPRSAAMSLTMWPRKTGSSSVVDHLGARRAGLGELAGDAAHLHDGHARGVGQHHGHLQDQLELVADGVGREGVERLGAVSRLEQERPALGDRREVVGQRPGLAREHQRRASSPAASVQRLSAPGSGHSGCCAARRSRHESGDHECSRRQALPLRPPTAKRIPAAAGRSVRRRRCGRGPLRGPRARPA